MIIDDEFSICFFSCSAHAKVKCSRRLRRQAHTERLAEKMFILIDKLFHHSRVFRQLRSRAMSLLGEIRCVYCSRLSCLQSVLSACLDVLKTTSIENTDCRMEITFR